MRVDEYEVPDDLYYTKEHEWARTSSSKKTIIGITDYAVKLLHDVVYVSLPEIGSEVRYMEVFGSVESIKAVSDLYCPLTGKVVAVNKALESKPELVSQSPYGEGWLIEVEPSNLDAESKVLMSADAYASYIRGLGQK